MGILGEPGLSLWVPGACCLHVLPAHNLLLGVYYYTADGSDSEEQGNGIPPAQLKVSGRRPRGAEGRLSAALPGAGQLFMLLGVAAAVS